MSWTWCDLRPRVKLRNLSRMSELAFGRTQEEKGGFCAEANPIIRNHYQRAASTNLQFDPFFIL